MIGPSPDVAKPSRPGRLLRRPDFLRAKAEGKSWVSETMIVNIRENGLGVSRMGLTVTKACGNAVARNRIRRRLRHAGWEAAVALNLQGVDLVLVGREKTKDAPWEKIQKDLNWCLKRLGVPQ